VYEEALTRQQAAKLRGQAKAIQEEMHPPLSKKIISGITGGIKGVIDVEKKLLPYEKEVAEMGLKGAKMAFGGAETAFAQSRAMREQSKYEQRRKIAERPSKKEWPVKRESIMGGGFVPQNQFIRKTKRKKGSAFR